MQVKDACEETLPSYLAVFPQMESEPQEKQEDNNSKERVQRIFKRHRKGGQEEKGEESSGK